METLGERVRNLRQAKGLTQEELGELAGMARTDVTRVETGHLGLGPARLARVAEALGVSVLELDPGAEPDERAVLLQDRLDEILAAINELDPLLDADAMPATDSPEGVSPVRRARWAEVDNRLEGLAVAADKILAGQERALRVQQDLRRELRAIREALAIADTSERGAAKPSPRRKAR